MAATTGTRKSVSIYDYPEHLNPFKDDDNHNKIRFWTLSRKRNSSINFSGLKELTNSKWTLKSFMKKGKKKPPAQETQDTKPKENGDTSPIVFRRSLQYSSMTIPHSRSTFGSPENRDRYEYGGSVTPLPRSRFQERLRTTSNYDVQSIGTPRMARSDVTGSRLSVESTNPFDEGPVPPARANRRKKKRAPLPPPGAADVSVSSTNTTDGSIEDELKHEDVDSMKVPVHIELKIVEDEEEIQKNPTVKEDMESTMPQTKEIKTSPSLTNSQASQHSGWLEIVEMEDDKTIQVENDNNSAIVEEEDDTVDKKKENPLEIVEVEVPVIKSDSEDDILNKVSFSKVDIAKYRRNSSVNDEDITLRRGNLEDYAAPNKRSKSLNNDLNSQYVTYDINLNENKAINGSKGTNGNDGPQKVVCKLYNEATRKKSLVDSISSREREFKEFDKATRELEQEISKLNSALINDDEDDTVGKKLPVSKHRFKNNNVATPNPIPKPRRSNYESTSPINSRY